jgi:hypothetical protein
MGDTGVDYIKVSFLQKRPSVTDHELLSSANYGLSISRMSLHLYTLKAMIFEDRIPVPAIANVA